jgi:Concanavalin A-like lectin/glucanases superfamily
LNLRAISLAISLLVLVGTAHADITSNLTAHFALNENTDTTTVDAVGGLMGTLTNGPTWVAGRSGSAVTLAAASSQYITIPDAAALDLTADFTVALWVRSTQPAVLDTWPVIVGKGPNTGWQIALHNSTTDATWYGCIYAAGGCASPRPGPNDISDGAWHHLAMKRAGSTMTLYQDGVAGAPSTKIANSLANADALHLSNLSDLGACCYFSGTVDDVRLYSRALSDADLTELFRAGGRRRGLVLP